MHGIAEHIRIMNENNARLIQHLTTNNPPPPAVAPIPEEVEHNHPRIDDAAHRANAQDEEEALSGQSLGHLTGLVIPRFNQAMLEVEGTSDKVVVMAMMEGLHLGPLFDSLFQSFLEAQAALQSKADKYIAAKELAEAKHRRRGREDHKKRSLSPCKLTIETR
ncbi:hypothetical protein Acr_01g0007020 [Actinidia rufa]|uniref:Uncharacterized protein n=1 Tax=Actinidia rufa TaxID=165716 RepID=A0A7J0E2Y9_9ERIC|nr:hypothetical protein Acr_01g0007020 [Actinidia rufa]